MDRRVLITGGEGQLGRELTRMLGNAATPVAREALDITDRQATRQVFDKLEPDVVVNCAAYTAVDQAEKDVERCRAVNALGVLHLAEACRATGCRLVHVSTDYVFDGVFPEGRNPMPYSEESHPAPQSVYAQTKLEGEAQAALCENHLIVRSCGLYGLTPAGRNFVETMLRLAQQGKRLRVVHDQQCTPTYTLHLARAIAFLLSRDDRGLLHVVDSGSTTWHAFACEIFRQAKMDVHVEPITAAEYGAAAIRPAYSVLDATKYHLLGGPAMPDWRQALGEYLRSRAVSDEKTTL